MNAYKWSVDAVPKITHNDEKNILVYDINCKV